LQYSAMASRACSRAPVRLLSALTLTLRARARARARAAPRFDQPHAL